MPNPTTRETFETAEWAFEDETENDSDGYAPPAVQVSTFVNQTTGLVSEPDLDYTSDEVRSRFAADIRRLQELDANPNDVVAVPFGLLVALASENAVANAKYTECQNVFNTFFSNRRTSDLRGYINTVNHLQTAVTHFTEMLSNPNTQHSEFIRAQRDMQAYSLRIPVIDVTDVNEVPLP